MFVGTWVISLSVIGSWVTYMRKENLVFLDYFIETTSILKQLVDEIETLKQTKQDL